MNLYLKAINARDKSLLTLPEFTKALMKLGANIIDAQGDNF